MDANDLIPNPTFTASKVGFGPVTERLATAARMKHAPIRQRVLDKVEDADLFTVLLEMIEQPGTWNFERMAPLLGELCAIGFFVKRGDVPELFGKIEYLWEGALDQLVASRFRSLPLPDPAELRVNPHLKLCGLSDLGDDGSRAALEHCLRPGDALATLFDPGTLCTSVFPFASRHASELERLVSAASVQQLKLPPDTLRRYFLAGLVVRPGDAELATRRWQERLRTGAESLSAQGFAALPDVCNPYMLAALRKHYRSEIAQGRVEFGDFQSRRWKVHDEPFGRYVHEQLVAAVSRLTGEAQRASFVYFSGYVDGAVLERHVDREQSQLAVTLLLDYMPEPELTSPWALFLEHGNPTQVHAAYQQLGDALAFRGSELPHYRSPLAEGHSSSSLLLMYVPSAFSGKLE